MNISPDVSTRMSIKETKEKFDEIFFGHGNPSDYDDLIDSFNYDSELTTEGIREDIRELKKIRTTHN